MKICKKMQGLSQDKKHGKTYGTGINGPKQDQKVKPSKIEGPPVPCCKHWASSDAHEDQAVACKTTYKPKGK
jgi:hypothetical protein